MSKSFYSLIKFNELCLMCRYRAKDSYLNIYKCKALNESKDYKKIVCNRLNCPKIKYNIQLLI